MDSFFEFMTIGFVLALPFATIIISKYLKYKETVALAKEGLLREDRIERRGNKTGKMYKQGVSLIAIGSALTLGLLSIGFGPWIIGGLIPLFLGVGFLYLNSIESESLPLTEEDIDDLDDAYLRQKVTE